MAFSQITRQTLELLAQGYRTPGVLPGPVPPGRGDAADPHDTSYPVADELIRAIPFVTVGENGEAVGRQYQVRAAGTLDEPEFTARPGGTPWTAGATMPFGQELEPAGARFKRISTFVRADTLMSYQASPDLFDAQVTLARVAIVRSLSEAVLHSAPANDDAEELAGLPFFLTASPGQDVLYDPAAGMMGGLSEIEARCRPSDGDFGAAPDAFVMSSRGRWRLLKELEDKGLTPDFRYCPVTRKVQLHFHGIPVLTGRVPEPAGVGATTAAWALKLFGPSGIRVYHVGGQSEEYGLRVEETTTVAAFDAQSEVRNATRGVEVFGVYSLRVPEAAAVARLRGVPIDDPITQP